jgi:hypothetical protein
LNEHLASLSVPLALRQWPSSDIGFGASLIPFGKWLRAAGICTVEARDVEQNGTPDRQV